MACGALPKAQKAAFVIFWETSEFIVRGQPDRGGNGSSHARGSLRSIPIARCVLVKRTRKGPLRDVLARDVRRLRVERRLSQEGLAYRTYLSGEESARLR
jgi:hypothetical protein